MRTLNEIIEEFMGQQRHHSREELESALREVCQLAHRQRELFAAEKQVLERRLEKANRKGEDLTVSGISAVGAMCRENDELKETIADLRRQLTEWRDLCLAYQKEKIEHALWRETT